MGVRGVMVGLLAGATVTGLAAAGMASAAIPSASGGVVTACVNRSSGSVRVIDVEARRRCTAAERTVTWARNVARGTWSSRAVYAAGDTVQRAGSTWQARRASKGRTPAAGSYWTLLAAAGAPGPQGPQGVPGPQGPAGPQGRAGTPGTGLGTYGEGLPNNGTFLSGVPLVVAATDSAQTPTFSGAWFGALGFPAQGALLVNAAVEVRTTGTGSFTCDLQGSVGGAGYTTKASATSTDAVLRFSHPFIRFANANPGPAEHYRVSCTGPGSREFKGGALTVIGAFRPYA